MGIWKTGREQGNALIIGKRYEMSQKQEMVKKQNQRAKRDRNMVARFGPMPWGHS